MPSNLKQYLKQKNIKQVEFARAIGTAPSTASLYVNSWVKFPERLHAKSAKFLGLSEGKFRKILGRHE